MDFALLKAIMYILTLYAEQFLKLNVGRGFYVAHDQTYVPCKQNNSNYF